MVEFTNPPYITIYLDNICYLNNLPNSCLKVLHGILWIAGRDTSYVGMSDFQECGIIQLNPHSRRVLMEKLGYKNSQSITNALSELVKHEVLFRLDRGAYQLNPDLFRVGTWKILQ